MRFVDFFSGIGGFSLGLSRAGMEPVGAVEIDEFARDVYSKNFPGVPLFHDIRKLSGDDLPEADVWAGGFPCQEISCGAPKFLLERHGVGLAGERSGLWWEWFRLISEVRPRIVIVENVPNLLVRGFGRVLGAMAEIGYDAEWEVISAEDCGSPQIRSRLWAVFYPQVVSVGDCYECEHCSAPVCPWCQGHYGEPDECHHPGPHSEETLAHAENPRLEGVWERLSRFSPWWDTEPRLERVAHGIPAGVVRSRLHGIGNTVVPQIVQAIGERVMEAFRYEV